MIEAGLSRARIVSEAELEMEEKKKQKMLEWNKSMGMQRVANEQQLSAVRVREREDLERLDASSDARTLKRIAEQKKLVETQNVLASRLANAGANPRQIGYITGELD